MKSIWIFYPCAARKKYYQMQRDITMLKQFAIFNGYKVVGVTTLESSFIHEEDLIQMIDEMKAKQCATLLLNDIRDFCRNEYVVESFLHTMVSRKIEIITLLR